MRARIFEPFFTTKERCGGTGLGLSICQKLVLGFGGRLELDSTVGVGTTFRVVLASVPEPMPAPAKRSLPTRRRVLVIDDDEAVLRSIQRLLATEHDVVLEQSAHGAMHRLEDDPEGFSLILCDVQMPGMNGIELYQAVAPEVASRFVFMTGCLGHQDLSTVSARIFEKPFDAHGLRALVAG